ncbi:MAG: hypothetical protein U5R31_06945 [Acidimicrobiia bacterium]|nr:hypothetical protein [Acidimicrobiia bacterium]
MVTGTRYWRVARTLPSVHRGPIDAHADTPTDTRARGDAGMTRRSVVLTLAGTGMAGAAVLAGVRLLDSIDDAPDAGTGASGTATPDEAIAAIGVAYREAYPREDDAEALDDAFPQWRRPRRRRHPGSASASWNPTSPRTSSRDGS